MSDVPRTCGLETQAGAILFLSAVRFPDSDAINPEVQLAGAAKTIAHKNTM